MSDGTHSSDDGLLDYLRLARVGRHRTVEGEALERGLSTLRAWQSERLARTHADLLVHARYGPACRFFLTDVYAARDFSQRDHDLLRVYESMRIVLPPSLRRALELAIVLNDLTLGLDEALLRALGGAEGVANGITAERYAEAYRRCDNYADRARQIDLVVEVGRQIDHLVHKPAVGMALRLARVPARLAGWHEHQDFLERGFTAFKRMNAADEFLATLAGRERVILDRIYARLADPFDVA
jgi:hypothetical protein